jgi:negative regulator of flagellin synthesis FlgM
MRIDLNGISLNGTEREDKTKKTGAKPTSAAHVEDKASLSTDTLSLSSLEAKVQAAPEVRHDRVDALRQAIQNGEYEVDPQKIAHAILEHNKR